MSVLSLSRVSLPGPHYHLSVSRRLWSHANFTMLEEIPLGEEVFAGTFFLYEHLIIILFDSRA
jgi:hypothetical protein